MPHKSSATTVSYERHKRRAREWSRHRTLVGQDIAPLRPVVDPARRRRADVSFREFCESYFPHLFTLAWSDDHLKVIAAIERAVCKHETLAIAMPRGSGKTSLCMVAVIWAIVTGRHRFVLLVAATDEMAGRLLANIKSHLASNDGLLADYPEATYPIRCLDGETRRCNGQRYYGRLTRIEWGVDQVVLPTLPNSGCSGSILRVAGLSGAIRGPVYVRSTGEQERPTLAIVDDPQTDQTARSWLLTRERLDVLNGAVRHLAGPGERTGVIVPCTVIQPGDLADQLLDKQKNPTWHGHRTKLLYGFPSADRLWSEYFALRDSDLQADGDGSIATEFYRVRRSEMDAGATPAWPGRYLAHNGEISAVQHAMNLWHDDPQVFAAEYQNEPVPDEDDSDTVAVTADRIASKVNGFDRGIVPRGVDTLTAYVDVHDKALFWAVCGFTTDYVESYVLDYGTWPEQRQAHYTLRGLQRTLQREYRGAGATGAVLAGLVDAISRLIDRRWSRSDGTVTQIAAGCVDEGYLPDVVQSALIRVGRLSTWLPAKGVGIRAAWRPVREFDRTRSKVGHHWWINRGAPGHRELRHVNIDTNYWKTFVHAALAVPLGDPGCLSLPGRNPIDHQLFADHLAAETAVRVEARGRAVNEWDVRPGRPDNHWFDAVVGCFATASMQGLVPAGTQRPDGGGRRMVKLSDLQRDRRGRRS